jgi:hypothetical protein
VPETVASAPEPEPVPEPAPEPEAAPEPEPEDKPLVDAVAAALATPADSPWDAPVEAPAAITKPKPSAESWVDDDLPSLDAKDFGLPQIAGSGIRTGQTIPPTEQQPVKAAEPPAVAAPASEPPPAAPRPVRPAAASRMPPPQIMSEFFKGGVDARIEPQRTFVEALGGLLALDHQLASNNRTYWWCPQSANGYASFFSKQGLPDPYYFSRMIRFAGGQR